MGDDSTEPANHRYLTGAEAISRLMVTAGVAEVFAYPGTSELALCDEVARQAGRLTLVNGRGDTESAFMAAGASLLRPNRGAAILHGARGLTNAAGAVAEARRNEVGTVLFVGLASTASAPFLPPHGEADLFGGMSAFADWVWQAPAVPEEGADRQVAAAEFVASVRRAFAAAAGPPSRPALFGLPQDVAERRWIPVSLLDRATPQIPGQTRRPVEADRVFAAAVGALARARRPLFLIDDYALRFPGIHGALDRISRATGALVLQVRYRRGPMMFERLRAERVANFAGWLEPRSAAHQRLLESCDLLVTVEDRNIYPRVVGELPAVPKLALNTDPAMVHKNGYLRADDTLLAGDPAASLDRLLTALAEFGVTGRAAWCPLGEAKDTGPGPEPADPAIVTGRRLLTRTLAEALSGWERPVLVDDSQMFGGLLSDHYDEFPVRLRAFGGHGGFVGSGLSLATGLALGEPGIRVLCTLGDQAFTSSFQGLVAAVEQRARVLFVVCNNGRSVSLTKHNCTYNAVELFGAENIEIVNCDFSGSGGMVPPGPGKNHNLKMNHVSQIAISGSRFDDSMWGHGIAVIFGREVMIRDCELARNQLDGAMIAESSQVTVEGCLAEGNGGAGIAQETWMEPSRGVTAHNNILRNNVVTS